MPVPDRVRLPLQFDIPALAAEAEALDAGAWVPHFNRDIYEGEWSGVALRSPGGAADRIYPDPAPTVPYADTEWLDHCPAYREALAQFHCPTTAIRLLALGPGAVLKEHADYHLGWEDGEIRVHVPIVTADEVTFTLDGHPVALPVGEAWYLNFNKPHSAVNSSSVTRIHLVVDCVVNDWLAALVEQAVTE